MKNLLLICGLCILVGGACGQARPPIQSIGDVQPYLEKQLGIPTSIDTHYVDTQPPEDFTTIFFKYENRPDLNYQKIAEVLSKGFGEPVYARGKSKPHITGKLIPLYQTPWGNIYKVQFGVSPVDPPLVIISVFDDKNEIPIPAK